MHPIAARAQLLTAHRIVVKIGSSSLTGADGHLNLEALRSLVQVIADRHDLGLQTLLVTSGAVAAGIGPLGLPSRPRDVATAQAAASVGQGMLVARYAEAFADRAITVGQILLTAEDTVRRTRYKNAQRSLERLFRLGVVPIVNENDAVVTDELRFGDNDRLAALVAQLVGADALVLLTDVDGLYDGPPSREGTRRITEVLGPSDLEGIEVSGRGSDVGTGGMLTKLESVSIATGSGIPVVLTKADNARPAIAGERVGTWFAPTGKRSSRKRLWIAHAARVQGKVVLDDGAVDAVLGGRASLLAAGIVDVEGEFVAGDPVELVSKSGAVIARGLSGFDSVEIPEMLGQSSSVLRESLGSGYDREVIHRDDLVLVRPKGLRVN